VGYSAYKDYGFFGEKPSNLIGYRHAMGDPSALMITGNLQSATIYFDEVDARKFKEKVNESLEGLK
jgi:hypothetical protein